GSAEGGECSDSATSSDGRPTQTDQDRTDEARKPVERRRPARRAAGEVDDARPRNLIEDDLNFRQNAEMLAATQKRGVDRSERERRTKRAEHHRLALRVLAQCTAQVDEGGRAEEQREKAKTKPCNPGEPVPESIVCTIHNST